jgi:hypothetical protein
MRELLRRAPRSKAHQIVLTGMIALAAGVPAAGSSPSSSHVDALQSCAGATATREYTAEAMTFRLRLDLDGCRWWDGSARNLVVFLSRDDGRGPASRYSTTACESGSGPDADRTTVCEAFTTVHHPAEEQAAAYQGEATWKWQDGERRVSFETRCTTSQGEARCDNPVASWRD